MADRAPHNRRYQSKFAKPGALSNLPAENNFADEAVAKTYAAVNELQAVLLTDRLVEEIGQVHQGGKLPPPLQYRRSRPGDPGE